MKIDLCKLFNVEEGEEFKIEYNDGIYDVATFKIKENNLYSRLSKDDIILSTMQINVIKSIKNITKLPKKKQFSQDTLNFFKLVDKKWEWVAKDKDGKVFVYDRKPIKTKSDSWNCSMYCRKLDALNQSLFDKIYWEDEEPIRIDDYVER